MRDYLSDRRKQLKKIKNGKGVQHILDEASEILGNPILMIDMEYKLIAYAGNSAATDPIWNEFITTGTVGHDKLEFFKEESFLEAVANTQKVTFLISDKLKHRRIFGKIYTKNNIRVGGAIIRECDNLFEEDIPELFEVACDILTREISNDEFYQDYGQTYRESLISKLIEGSITDRRIYVAHVADLYDGLGDTLYLAVADISLCDSEHIRPTHLRDLFFRIDHTCKYFIYSKYIVIIFSTDKEVLNVKKDLIDLYTFFSENNISTGISSGFDNLYDLKRYYNEAVSALNFGVQTNGNQRLFLYNGIR